MSSFWSWYIIVLVALNIGGCVWLLMWTRKMDLNDMPADGTTGHEYDGIREYNNPLPRWWLSLFWITIVFGVAYLALYPGLGNFKGVLGWTQTGEVAADQAAYEQKFGAIYANYAKVPIAELAKDERAMKIGGRLFANNCSTCHGTDANGAKGFPNLTDGDWLWGGEPDRIVETIMQGRTGMMPAWQAIIGDDGVKKVSHHVLALAGRKADAGLAAAGAEVFATNCAACHGGDGKGNPLMGAPNLTDNVWLYGGSEASVIKTVAEGRGGHMPAQQDVLGAERVHLLAAYVWSLSHNR
ncbi:MAG: cytochrome oxidase Cbb3 [Moraxellaceae bacterium]|jgi:cytochrome c oxidase cbb3-type subunit 3|nr:cytochrome oxidase Cbb3 [Moraxellaceae bacterium]